VLDSPGGELPFTLRVTDGDGSPPAVALNGEEEAPFTAVRLDGSRVVLRIEGYDSEIDAQLSDDGRLLAGEWSRTSATGRSRLPFRAVRGETHRFAMPLPDRSAGADRDSILSVAGTWSALFVDEDGKEQARAEFRQEGERVTGTILTPTGDYRYLEGDYRDGFLRLSCFDGAHVFLFHARAMADGTLQGDFWSRDTYHATWSARLAGNAIVDAPLPDPFEEVHLTNDAGRFAFRFPDLDGHEVALPGERFHGKVVVVNLFGSWCPNCNDEAPLLAGWHRRYRDRGLEIIGLAYEYTGDTARDRSFVRRFAERHRIEYPLLLAGTSDRADAGATLADLSPIKAWPTTMFIGRDGRVRRIYSGFAGPATGATHTALVGTLENLLEELLSESPPDGGA
jgi:thiol-disulfide isomerase/thioredoxin